MNTLTTERRPTPVQQPANKPQPAIKDESTKSGWRMPISKSEFGQRVDSKSTDWM